MKTSIISALILLSLLSTPLTTNAALTCAKLAPLLSLCNNYMQASNSSPITPDKLCCDGMSTAIALAVSQADRRVTCGCIMAMGHGDFVSVDRAAFIPSDCGITLPWHDMGPKTQCTKL